MRELVRGHIYELDNQHGQGTTELRFYMDPELHRGVGHDGPINQEVLRALIFRVKALDNEKPWGGNRLILQNLREAIILHEMRAASRKGLCTQAVLTTLAAWDAKYGIETIPARASDGHIFPLEAHTAAECRC